MQWLLFAVLWKRINCEKCQQFNLFKIIKQYDGKILSEKTLKKLHERYEHDNVLTSNIGQYILLYKIIPPLQ